MDHVGLRREARDRRPRHGRSTDRSCGADGASAVRARVRSARRPTRLRGRSRSQVPALRRREDCPAWPRPRRPAALPLPKTDDSKGCGRTFNALSGTAFARMRKPELWMRYAAELARGTSLTKIVDDVGLPINRHTAWRWRHRLLAALEPPKVERLDGIVEVDETFFPGASRVVALGSVALRRRTVRRAIAVPARSCPACRISRFRS